MNKRNQDFFPWYRVGIVKPNMKNSTKITQTINYILPATNCGKCLRILTHYWENSRLEECDRNEHVCQWVGCIWKAFSRIVSHLNFSASKRGKNLTLTFTNEGLAHSQVGNFVSVTTNVHFPHHRPWWFRNNIVVEGNLVSPIIRKPCLRNIAILVPMDFSFFCHVFLILGAVSDFWRTQISRERRV